MFFKNWKRSSASSGQKGSVFTVLLAGIAMVGILSVASYNILTGPVATMAKSNLHLRATNDMNALSKIIMRHAGTLPSGGDCDGDGYVEPVEFSDPASPATADHFVPTNIGAPITDPWGTRYMYCPFDLGTTGDTGCNRDGVGGNQYYTGSSTPLAGNENSRYAFAVLTAGPDRIYQTTCANFVNSTTAVVVPGGDDIVQTFTYEQAAAAVPEYWSLTATSAETSKTVVEVQDSGGQTKASLTAGSGLGAFGDVTTTGLVTAPGGIQVGTDADVQACSASDTGLVRYNAGGSSSSTVGTGPIVVEQQTTVASVYGATTASTRSFSTLPGAGNAIVVAIAHRNGCGPAPAAPDVTDNQGNVYTQIMAGEVVGGNETTWLYASGDIGAPSGTFTITVDYNDNFGCSSFNWGAMEISGLGPTISVDQSIVDSNAAAGTSTTLTAPGATDQAHEIAIAIHMVDPGNGVNTGYSVGAGWVEKLKDNDPGDNGIAMHTATRILTATETPSVTWNYTNCCGGTTSFGMVTLRSTAGASSDPIAVVQSAALVENGPADSVSASFTSLPAAGNTIIVGVGGAADSGTFDMPANGVTDNQGNTYTLVATSGGPGPYGVRGYIYAAYNIGAPSGTFTITVNPTTASGVSYQTIAAIEVSGLATASTVDVTGTGMGTSGTSTTVTATGATSQADELVFAFASADGDFPSCDCNLSAGAGWTQHHVDNGCGNSACVSSATRILSATETPSHTWTHNTGSSIGIPVVLATFKGASGGSGGGSCGGAGGDVTDGLIHRWKFDETSGTAADDSVGSNNGTFAGDVGPGWTTGLDGNALETVGDMGNTGNGYVDVGEITALNGASQITYSAWVRRNYNPDETIVIGRNKSGWTETAAMYLWGDGYAGCNIGDNYYIDTPAPGTGWYHLAMVFDGTQTGNANRLKCYVNGVLATGTYSGTIPATIATASGTVLDKSFKIGGVNMYGSDLYAGDGKVDDVRIYNRALSAEEISSIYSAMPRPVCATAECGGDSAKRVVFTTDGSASGGGGWKGVVGADHVCTSKATAAGLSGTYKAWIADSTAASAPATRFEQATVPYVKVDGTVVANDWTDLTDGTIDSPINLDESGNGFGPTNYVTSNVNSDGTQTSAANHCSNWTSGTGTVSLGRLNQSSSQWSAVAGGDCSWGQFLYCFEQPEASASSGGTATVVQKSPLGIKAGGAGTTQTTSFSTLPSAGNSIIVIAVVADGGTGGGQLPANGITDNQGNTYAKVAGSTLTSDFRSNTYIYAAHNITAPSGTFTVTADTAGAQGDNYILVGAMEVSGLAASPNDASGQTTSNTYGSNGTISTSAATTEASEFAVAALSSDGVDITGVSSGWVEEFLNNATGVTEFSVVSKTTSATGVVSHQWTHGDVYNQGAIATFKIAPASSTCSAGLQVCNGTQWVNVGNGSSGSSSTTNEFWQDLAGGPPAPGIYYSGGNVMIGTNTDVPAYLFNVTGDATRGGAHLYSYSGTYAPQVTFRRSRGTEASPTTVANGDYFGSMEFYSRVGGSWVSTGHLVGGASSGVSGNIIPSSIALGAMVSGHTNPYTAFLMNTGANRMQPLVLVGYDGTAVSNFTTYTVHSKAADNGMSLISTSGVPEILLRRARGTVSTPAAVASGWGDTLGAVVFNGYDSNSWNGYTPGIAVNSAGTVTTTSLPAHLYLYPGFTSGTDGIAGLHFTSDGYVGWSQTDYGQKFHMQGSINVSDDASPDTIPTNLSMPAGGSLVIHGGKGAVKGGYRDGPWTLNEADIGTASFAFGGDGSRAYTPSSSEYVVQSATASRGDFGDVTVNFSQPVTPGNTVVIFAHGHQNINEFALTGVPTDNYGNTYTEVYSTTPDPDRRAFVYTASGVLSGSSTFAVTTSTNGNDNAYGYMVAAVELANLSSTSLDYGATASQNSTVAATSTTVTTGNTAQADTLALTFFAGDMNASDAFAFDNSWNEIIRNEAGTMPPYVWDSALHAAYKINNAVGNFTHTVNHNAVDWGGTLVVIPFAISPIVYSPPENLLVGHATDDGTADVMGPGPYVYSDEHTAAASGTAVSMVFTVTNGNNLPVRVGVYNSSDVLIGQGTRDILPVGPGTYDIALDAPVTITAGQTYRLVVQSDDYIGMDTDTGAGGEWHCWMSVQYEAGLPGNYDCQGTDFGGTLNLWLRSSDGSGLGARATANTAFAFGQDALATGSPSVAIGYETEATAANAIAMGYGAKVTGIESIAVGGQNNRIDGAGSIAVAGGGSGSPSIVQQIDMRFDNHLGVTHGNMEPWSFTNAPSVGNGIVVVVLMTHYMGEPDPPTITDNHGNTYTRLAVAPDVTAWDIHWHPQIFHAPVTATGSPFSISLTEGAGGYVESWMAFEVSGMDNSSPLDGVAYRPGEPTGGNLTMTSASNMVSDHGLGIGMHRCLSTADNYSISQGWTLHGYLNGFPSDYSGGGEHTISYISGPTEGGQSLIHRWNFVPGSCSQHIGIVANMRGVTLEAGGHNIDADRAIAFGGPIDMTAAADYSVGINLGPSRVTMSQPSTFAIMNGKVGLGTVTPCAGEAVTCALQVVGDTGLSTGSAWTNVSDIRLKDIHGPYDKGLAEILKLQPVLYNYKKDNPRGNPSDQTYTGFIAQDVMKVFPEAVTQGADGYYNFSMHHINVALVNAVQELSKTSDGMNDTQTAMNDAADGTARDLAALEKDITRMEEAAAGKSPLATLGMAAPAGLLLLLIGYALKRRENG